MSAFACCFWWFLLGVLLGWLLNWLISKWMRGDDSGSAGGAYTSQTAMSPPPAAMPQRMMAGGVDVVAAAAAGFSVKGDDDIIIIEGIGPKIKALFAENGITTFAQVARMSVADMSAILDKGGARFKMANPGSWAEQARLAAENRWQALKKLQDDLYAGVEVTDDDDSNKA
jgi:predicted flap endonuclease-1-like 5' DNA nuclease